MGGGNYSRKKIIKNLFQLHIIESTHSKQKKAGNFLNTLFPVLIVLTDDFPNCKPHQYKSHGPVFQGRTLGKAGVRGGREKRRYGTNGSGTVKMRENLPPLFRG